MFALLPKCSVDNLIFLHNVPFQNKIWAEKSMNNTLITPLL